MIVSFPPGILYLDSDFPSSAHHGQTHRLALTLPLDTAGGWKLVAGGPKYSPWEGLVSWLTSFSENQILILAKVPLNRTCVSPHASVMEAMPW